ncbi:MAG TPA: hypothetical protein O0X39_00560 [Methanocorpusculum sp.]|nr:hypothetical protein [Methanocorpusculum sp.]
MDDSEIQIIVNRISQIVEKKGVTPDRQAIFAKLATYINDFGVIAYEAERKVQDDVMKEYNIPIEIKQSQNSGTEEKLISAMQPGDWVNLVAKVVSVQEGNGGAIAQSGVFADESGAIRFVKFAKASALPDLQSQCWYRIESAVVDSFNGAFSLKMHSGTKVSLVDEERCLVPAAPQPLSSLKPGVAPCVRVRFIDEWEVRSDRMLQTGLVGDESGKMKFVLWKSGNPEKLAPGCVYNIYYAGVSEFNGKLSLDLNSALYILDEDAEVIVKPSAPKEPLPVTQIRDLKPGYASLRVKFIEQWESRSERMKQTGLIGDESDRMKFVLWEDDTKPCLEIGKIYTITNAKIEEYNGRLSASLNFCDYKEEPDATDFEVGTRMDEVRGTIVQISGGSGLVKRCPVPGCNRVLSRQNLCTLHDIQNDFIYDLRVKAVVDDGIKAHNVLMGREVTEALSGITLDEAKEIGTTNPLGLEEVARVLGDKLSGRYVICKGSDFDNRLLVKEAEFEKYDSTKVVDLLNRASAGGVQ